jgi:hypothetical protein
MRMKQLDHLLQVKISAVSKKKLDEASERTGINTAELARLCLRMGLPRLMRKLPEITNE